MDPADQLNFDFDPLDCTKVCAEPQMRIQAGDEPRLSGSRTALPAPPALAPSAPEAGSVELCMPGRCSHRNHCHLPWQPT